MGFEDRDYTREGDYTGTYAGWSLDFISPVVKWLIVVNVVVFLAQIFLTRSYTPADHERQIERMPKRMREMVREQERQVAEERKKHPDDPAYSAPIDEYGTDQRVSLLDEWFALETRQIVFHGQIWRLVTYAFCHERLGIWHILLNMAALFWFGITMETMYGQREFLLFYLCAAVFSGLLNIALDLWMGSSIPVVGASGAVMAVLMLYAIHYPRNTIRLWFFPIEARWLVVIYVIITVHPLLLAVAGEQLYTGVAHAAHLGGLVFGFFYWKFDVQLERWWDKLPKLRVGTGGRGPSRRSPSPIRRSAERQMEDEVDDILRKLHESGEASLTDQERRTLARASERYKRKQG